MKRLSVAPLLALALAAPGIPAAADVFIVTKTADTLDGACDTDCSLREAVTAANARKGLDVVRAGPGTYTLTRTGAREGNAVSGDLDVRDDLLILGAGADRTVFDGNGTDRVLDADSGGLEVRGVTIRNGRSPDHQGPYFDEEGTGGGIRAASLVTLVDCLVTGNRSDTYGGGVSASDLIARDSTFSGNESRLGGGISSFYFVQLSNVTLSGNRASFRGGGAYLLVYISSLSHVTVTGNQAQEGGGVAQELDIICPDLCEVSFSLESSLIAGNTAEAGADCYGAGPTVTAGHAGGANVFGVGEGCLRSAIDRAGTAAAPLDPRLSPLGDHGGPTPTHTLLEGSPAIDIAPASACSGADQRGFPRPADGDGDGAPACDAGAVERAPGCQPDSTTLCLGAAGRFQATARWTTKDGSGEAQTVPLTPDSGAFWFFSPENLEIQIKVLDGCGVNDRFWVFASGLTDAGVEITVEDTLTGESWMYGSQRGIPFPTVTDTGAFNTCGAH
jgi:CSLREA domain-containing protein